MPGPRNSKGQKKLNALREKKRKVVVKPVATPPVDRAVTRTDAAPHVGEQKQDAADVGESVVGLDEVERSLPREPPVYDAGTGPRVKSMDEFLRSSFASEPTWDDELCAEFAQEEMLEMLRTVLPEEMALCVWYNKSRRSSRVCPACRRIFQTGDVLSSPLRGLDLPRVPQKVYPQLVAEQGISGLCSTVCFALASMDHPEAVRLIFGKGAGDLDEAAWQSVNIVDNSRRDDEGLSMVLGMTRLDDLGLGQLLFP